MNVTKAGLHGIEKLSFVNNIYLDTKKSNSIGVLFSN